MCRIEIFKNGIKVGVLEGNDGIEIQNFLEIFEASNYNTVISFSLDDSISNDSDDLDDSDFDPYTFAFDFNLSYDPNNFYYTITYDM